MAANKYYEVSVNDENINDILKLCIPSTQLETQILSNDKQYVLVKLAVTDNRQHAILATYKPLNNKKVLELKNSEKYKPNFI